MMDHKKINYCHKHERCSTKFDERRKLESHMEKQRFRCDKCTEVLDTRLEVIEHKKEAHDFKCDQCKRL